MIRYFKNIQDVQGRLNNKETLRGHRQMSQWAMLTVDVLRSPPSRLRSIAAVTGLSPMMRTAYVAVVQT